MLSQEYAGPLFNSVRVTGQLVPLDGADSSQIALHDPYFDSVGKDLFVGAAHNHDGASAAFVSDHYPPRYHRRMSADTQVSSADSTTNTGSNPVPYSSSPDHHKHTTPESKMSSLVLPPINDLHRPLSPEHSDGSASTRSPQWQHQQQQHQQQHFHQQPSYSLPVQYAQMPPQHQQQLPFPPIDHVRPRPQLHIQPPEHHRLTPTSYPTPTTASTLNGYSTTTSNPSYNTYPPAYRPSPVQGIAQQPQQSYRPPMMNSSQTPTSQNGPIAAPLLTPATLAAAVGTQPRRRGKLPKPVTEFLKKWLLAHTDHPYPTEDEKKWLCSETGLSMSQVSNWMINARRRILAPAAKANAAQAAAAAATAATTVAPMGSSATATTASPYYSRSPPIRTVSGSSSDASMAMYGNGSAYAPARRESYAPYPHPASRVTNAHHPGAPHHHHHHHHAHGGYSPVASSPYPSSSAPPYPPAYHFQSASTSSSTTGGASGHNPTSSLAPYSSSPFDGSPTTPGGQQLQDLDAVSERTKSPAGEFAYAPQ